MAKTVSDFGSVTPFALVCALLALAAAGLGAGVGFVALAAIFAGVMAGLSRGMRWIGHLGYLTFMIGAIVALAAVWDHSGPTGWVIFALLGASVLGAVTLFAALWRTPEPREI